MASEQPGDAGTATLTAREALRFANRHWGVDGDIRALPSYDGQNFRLRAATGEYVLKVAYPPFLAADLDMENRALALLATREPTLAWPRVYPTLVGEQQLALPLRGQCCVLRLVSFVPGTPWAEAIGTVPPSQLAALHASLGRAVACLSRGLAGFRHPRATRGYDWNLDRFPGLLDEVPRITDPRLRGIVRTHAQAFCDALPSFRRDLPMAVLHNDANDFNVLVSDSGGGPQVTSVIDFGDMCTGFRIAELAIACTYAMQHEDDPATCARAISRGYVSQFPLLPVERAHLRDFILGRLCQSVLMATRAQRRQPDHPSAQVSQRGVRALLLKMDGARDDAGTLVEAGDDD